MIEHEILQLREAGGYAALPQYGLIEISGKDAARFLQSRTTNDVLNLQPGQGHLNSLIDRTAHLQAVFSLHRLEDAYWIIVERDQVSSVIEHLTQYHIRETLEIEDRSQHGQFLSVQGPRSRRLLMPEDPDTLRVFETTYSIAQVHLFGSSTVAVNKSITGEEGLVFWVINADKDKFVAALRQSAEDQGLIALSDESLEVARIEAGLPRYGIDMTSEELLPDTALEQATVSYTKGCYLGQEVIARIKTYSAPRKGLVGLIFAGDNRDSFPIGCECRLGDQVVASLRSNSYSPTLGRTIALAYVVREHRVPGEALTLDIGQSKYGVTVTLLPFYNAPSPEERARIQYEKALADFAADRNQEAIASLREALLLNPSFPDAYEALGVILSKQDQLDEAITVMHKLADMDPQSVMAHTNLSIFYMQKGDKETAEDEKAKAMVLRMEKLTSEMNDQKRQEEQQQRLKEDATERIGMFEQVLEIDAEDQLANYGLGNLYTEIEEYAKAIPHLEKAVRLKPTHTVAYLALGKAYAGVDDKYKAIETYKNGIAAASKRGDMMPLKDMQQRLSELEQLV